MMAVCEKCWRYAYTMSRITGRLQGDCYQDVLASRAGNPCTPKEQAGEFWDEEKQCDVRLQEDTTNESG
jgi:hypothetical protein